MRAVIVRRPGAADGLELSVLDKPVPGETGVLVRVHAATVTRGDVALRRIPRPMWPLLQLGMGLRRKRVLGHEFAGVVEDVGSHVTRVRRGDAVFGTTTGLVLGSHAEYVCVPHDGILELMPEGVTFDEAAAVPVGAMTALTLLRQAGVRPGMTVLVYGASGSVGTYAVQIAVSLGAEVTGVSSHRNLELVRSLAARAIDYAGEDFARLGPTHDVVFDAVGRMKRSDRKRTLKDGGRFTSVRTLARERAEVFRSIRDLLVAGSIRPVIDRRVTLDGIRDAHRYVEAGHKVGNVVITIETDADGT